MSRLAPRSAAGTQEPGVQLTNALLFLGTVMVLFSFQMRPKLCKYHIALRCYDQLIATVFGKMQRYPLFWGASSKRVAIH